MKLVALFLIAIVLAVCLFCPNTNEQFNSKTNSEINRVDKESQENISLAQRVTGSYTASTQLILYKGDITKLDIECITNASNPSGLGCNIPNHCIDSAIHLVAGPELLEECKKLNGVPTGEAKITKGYKLLAKNVIHVTGPQATEEQKETDNYDWDTFTNCYINVLNLAKKHQIKELALCCLSVGLYGYPKDRSASKAVNTVKQWIKNNGNFFNKIVFVVFTDDNKEIYEKLL